MVQPWVNMCVCVCDWQKLKLASGLVGHASAVRDREALMQRGTRGGGRKLASHSSALIGLNEYADC